MKKETVDSGKEEKNMKKRKEDEVNRRRKIRMIISTELRHDASRSLQQ